MKRKREVSFDAIDLTLLAAIILLLIALVTLGGPLILHWCPWVLAIVNLTAWPFWVWTCLGLALLATLFWLRAHYE